MFSRCTGSMQRERRLCASSLGARRFCVLQQAAALLGGDGDMCDGALLRRRVFIAGLGAAILAPRGAWGQPGERMRRVGVLMNVAVTDSEGQANLASFRNRLQ